MANFLCIGLLPVLGNYLLLPINNQNIFLPTYIHPIIYQFRILEFLRLKLCTCLRSLKQILGMI